MYLTAHHIRSPRGEEETQSFFHRHDAENPWPESPEDVPGAAPGTLVDHRGTIRPGGNTVLAFLDVWSERELSLSELEAILASLPLERWTHPESPFQWNQGGTVALRAGWHGSRGPVAV